MRIIGNIVLPDRILYGASLLIDGERIQSIEENYVTEAKELPYVAPGFVDIHNHGALGHDYMESSRQAFDRISSFLTRSGVTTAQCTTVSAPISDLLHFFRFYREYQKDPIKNRCRFVGIHVEGPYIAPASKGAHPLETLLTPEKDGYDWILENKDIITEITVAPELPGMTQMIRTLSKEGILISGGHDAAEPEEIEAAFAAGMRHCTHIYCGMSTLHKTNAHRRHGLCEFSMATDGMTAEMIADNHHTPPLLAKMIYQAKGATGACIVSDAIAPAGLAESTEMYSLGCGENCTHVFVEDGVAMVEDKSCYAGSIQDLSRMVRNLVFDAEIPLVDAVRMASLTPAEIIGLDSVIGSIEPGKRADLCFMNSDLTVLKTYVGGILCYDKEG